MPSLCRAARQRRAAALPPRHAPPGRASGAAISSTASAVGKRPRVRTHVGPSRASARVPARFADTASDDDDDDDDDGETNGKAAKNADDLWVCCDRCGKWRSLPSNVEAKRLAKRRWYCTMNPDPERNSCGAAEEDYRSTTRMSAKDRRMQEFLRQWVLRLKKIDAAEARLPRSVVGTRNKKRTSADTGWIQCCNPNCGKYRAVSTALEERVQENDEWFCVMNTWDEALSSCAAPQEIPER